MNQDQSSEQSKALSIEVDFPVAIQQTDNGGENYIHLRKGLYKLKLYQSPGDSGNDDSDQHENKKRDLKKTPDIRTKNFVSVLDMLKEKSTMKQETAPRIRANDDDDIRLEMKKLLKFSIGINLY